MKSARLTRLARYVADWASRKGAAAAVFLLLAALPTQGHAEALRLIALGDSLTHGYGLAQGEGFVPQLDRWLAEHGAPEVEVINMGVSGDTTAGGRARLDWALAEGADALILELGGNDLLRGIDPATSRANLDAMLVSLADLDVPVLLAGLEVPLNYGPDFKRDFEGMYVDLAAEHGALLYPSFLAGLEGPGMMQPDGIHPSAEGVAVIVDGIGPFVLDLLERASE